MDGRALHADTGAGPRSGGRWHERMGQLLVNARAGDREAIGELVRALTPLLWNVARAEGLDRDLAEDAVQDAWVSLIRSYDEIRSPQALTAWLMTVTRRRAQALHAGSTRLRTTDPADIPDVPDQDSTAEDVTLENEQYHRLWWNVQQLSPRCRKLLRIVAFVDRPDYDLVSRELQMPRGSIGPTRRRCLCKLRLLLASDPGWSSP